MDYSNFYLRMKSFDGYGKITEHAWAILSSLNPVQIRDLLKSYLDSTDRLMVLRSGQEGAWTKCIASNDWLKKNLVL